MAAGMENPAVEMAVALDLLPQIVRAATAGARRYDWMAVEEPVTVQASVLAGLIVLLSDALLSVVLEITDEPEAELLAAG